MPGSSDILNRRLSPSSLPSTSQSQLATQKPRPTDSKAPILLRISRTRHNQIRPWDTTVFLQPLLQLLIIRLLRFCVSSLLENLDEDELVRALEVEVRVFADDLVWLVLGYDLTSVRSVSVTWVRTRWRDPADTHLSWGGALNSCNIISCTISASFLISSGHRTFLIRSIL